MTDPDPVPEQHGAPPDPVLPLALCADAAFYEGLETAACSAVVASRGSCAEIRIHVIDGGLEPGQRRRLAGHVERLGRQGACRVTLQWTDFGATQRKALRGLRGHPSTYARLFLADMLPGEDWVVWLDADLLCLKDLAGIGSHLGENQALAAAADHCFPTLGQEGRHAERLNTHGLDLDTPYVNTGLAVFNLRLWREEELLPRLLAWAHDHAEEIRFKDQSVLNWNLAARTAHLPGDYNLFGHQGPRIVRSDRDPVVFHAAGNNKYWNVRIAPTLKGAELSFGDAVAAHHYLTFRERELGTDETPRLTRLREEVARHPYLRPHTATQRAYTRKLLTYALLNPGRFRQWRKKMRVHREIGQRAGGMLRGIVEG